MGPRLRGAGPGDRAKPPVGAHEEQHRVSGRDALTGGAGGDPGAEAT
ncbi:hypothetical protein ABZZ47_43340 [Streptomyces sp. NPDC006465]